MARLPYLKADQVAPGYRMLARDTNLRRWPVNRLTWPASSTSQEARRQDAMPGAN